MLWGVLMQHSVAYMLAASLVVGKHHTEGLQASGAVLGFHRSSLPLAIKFVLLHGQVCAADTQQGTSKVAYPGCQCILLVSRN